MRFKKVMCLVLSVLMLFGTVALLSSCNKTDGNVKLSKKVEEVDITGYHVVFADAANKTRYFQSVVTELADMVTERTGKSTMARAFTKTKSTAADPEILIGMTTREESQKAAKSIKGDGFTIQVINNKIVVLGTNNLLTMQAMNYFMENYLKIEGEATATIKINQKALASKVNMVVLADADGAKATFAYNENLHDKLLHPDTYFQGVYNFCDNRSYPLQAMDEIAETLASATSLKVKDFKSVKITEEVEGARFMVGQMNNDTNKACMAEISGDEYGLFVRNGDFVIAGWNDAALAAAKDVFVQLIGEATFVKDGKSYVAFPEGFKLVATSNSNWKTDFPKPEGLALYNTLDTGENGLQYLYKGENVNAAAFDSYVAALKDAGYVMLQENEIEGSKFATLVNNDEETMLYVGYNDFAHYDEYGPFKSNNPSGTSDYATSFGEKLLRVVSVPTNDTVYVPDNKLLKPQSYAKITETKVTSIALGKGSVGMCYIVMLEDGSFILFDGGTIGEAEAPSTQIYNALLALYKEAHKGAEPSAQDPIRIAAWVITHSHGDHYVVARQLMQMYGKSATFKVDYLIGNYPSHSAVYTCYNADIGIMSENNSIANMQAWSAGHMKFLKVHAGQKYYFANMEIEVMMTYDDLNPNPVINQNDTSTVLRFTVGSNGKFTDSDYTMLWLGDANQRQSRFLTTMYGDYLKSDLVQLAHHGNVGCETPLYSTVNAEIVLFPNSVGAYKSYMSGSGWVCDVDQTLIGKNPNTDWVVVAGTYDATLPFVNGKPQYDKIYDNRTGNRINPTGNINEGGCVVKVPDLPGETS